MNKPLEHAEPDFDDKSYWLDTTEAAIYLKAKKKDGTPCPGRIRNLVCQRRIPFYKPFGRLLFKRPELDRFVEMTRKEAINGYQSVRRR